ncbi:glycosyltransferase [Nocardioides sp. 1609]|uniref:glycosyltransferase n=1 Tax=Nocardioides sp. 1609 TaxID=2508327 RepID=UPI001FD6C885|nr:glycosyltransferase [Nocardioides sp. 1609]
MRICLIASNRFPIREPFAGGLEAMTHVLAGELAARGHDVTLFAGPGSDVDLPVRLLVPAAFEASTAALADRNAPSACWLAEHHAYLGLMLDLARTGSEEYDVVHNNSLHHLPVAMASAVDVPMLTTLHTPPLPLVESAISLDPLGSTFAAVSAFTAAAWAHAVPATVVHNGIDLARWYAGDGGGPAVWSGRVVPEKAPHAAMDACRRAGVPLVLVGPAHDQQYYRTEIEPRLGDGIEYAGHLTHAALGRLLREASVAVVTPAWDEPYGLVASEAMACGTPVAGYARGALPEVVGAGGGVLAPADDVDALAAAVLAAGRLDRRAVRAHAEATCSLTRMVDDYERCYEDLLDRDDEAA